MSISKLYKRKFLIIFTIILSFILIFIALSVGSSDIKISNIFSIILNKIINSNINNNIESKDISIIWNVRFPRVLLAFIVGAALSASGAVVQSILKNPLASPYTLGISSGASLGVGILVVSGMYIPILGNLSMTVVGFGCSLLTIILVISFANMIDGSLSNNTIILFGMVISLFLNAILTIVTALYTKDITGAILWQMGSFSMKSWRYFKLSVPFFIFGLFGISFYLRELDILTFGEENARAMGVETDKVKKRLFLLVAVLTGASVAIGGTIGFVDLIAPHLTRKLVGSKHSYVIPMSAILGGMLMVIADLISRTILIPVELPVGAVTAIIGAPFFTYLYLKKR
ncbi:FecCD family ABC transporter permease [Caproiciproducens sp. MSJ-32]|uniref:FecCD family ABC transporter permease n=1 Tax=Caproiciproducens sp. MSJ-32 TaxID=2841527 RepID=UPI001C125067|nr:iron ABC transporter permease [Caproiciproducens sp. MSJ-32]MBU5453976.1 iron ABC transporter permease [Caproiciproducens sp. MSJ-32]